MPNCSFFERILAWVILESGYDFEYYDGKPYLKTNVKFEKPQYISIPMIQYSLTQPLTQYVQDLRKYICMPSLAILYQPSSPSFHLLFIFSLLITSIFSSSPLNQPFFISSSSLHLPIHFLKTNLNSQTQYQTLLRCSGYTSILFQYKLTLLPRYSPYTITFLHI